MFNADYKKRRQALQTKLQGGIIIFRAITKLRAITRTMLTNSVRIVAFSISSVSIVPG